MANIKGYSLSWKNMKQHFPSEFRIMTLVPYSTAKYGERLWKELGFTDEMLMWCALSSKLNDYGHESKGKGLKHLISTLSQGVHHYKWLVCKTPIEEITHHKPNHITFENFTLYEKIKFEKIVEEINIFMNNPEKYLN